MGVITGWFLHKSETTFKIFFVFFFSNTFFLLLLFTTVLSQWEFSHGKFGLLSPGKASCDRVALPNLLCMLGVFSVSVIHQTLTWTTGSLTCTQMLMHAIAHGGGDIRTPWESLHWKLTVGEKSPAAPGNRTCVGGVAVQCSTNELHPQPINAANVENSGVGYVIMPLTQTCSVTQQALYLDREPSCFIFTVLKS